MMNSTQTSLKNKFIELLYLGVSVGGVKDIVMTFPLDISFPFPRSLLHAYSLM